MTCHYKENLPKWPRQVKLWQKKYPDKSLKIRPYYPSTSGKNWEIHLTSDTLSNSEVQ